MSASVMERAVELCDTFANKSGETTLQEFEQLCYERLCDMIAVWALCNELSYKEDVPELEKKVRDAEEKANPTPKVTDEDEEPEQPAAT
jgi:hypothetical protein